MPANDRALCSVLAILSGSGLVPGFIPKCNMGIPICWGNALGTSLSDRLHIISPDLVLITNNSRATFPGDMSPGKVRTLSFSAKWRHNENFGGHFQQI
ncbi:hypothetical protein Tco_0166837 [Tanacetum coccineum]